MSKRKHEPEANDRNVRKKTEEINILPAVDEAETVPVAFKYEEVVVNPESSPPLVKKTKKKKKAKPVRTETETPTDPVSAATSIVDATGLPVALDPVTGLPITTFPSYYPGTGYGTGYNNNGNYTYPYSAAPLEAKKRKDRKPKVLRAAGGEVWEDETLQSWPKSNLGNEVNDDALKRAFHHYKSAVRARVIRDKRTGKSKGFGFVSFMDANDFVRALREMNGKYIGNRPCKLTKSTWDSRNISAAEARKRK